MNRYPNAANGLKLMFYGQIVTIIGMFLSWVPLVGLLIVLAGGIVNMVGLYKAGSDDQGYRTAFMLTIVGIVVNIVSSFAGNGFWGSMVNIISSVVSLAVIYFVCITTGNLLHSIGEDALSDRGHTVWMINLVCTVVAVVVTLLAYVPVLNILAALAAIVMVIVELVGYIMYLMFLNSSSKVL